MPRRLRPTAPTASGAVLVGDPGRALLLAQELLTEPKMSNHARGLWGYFGTTATGEALTIQSTGIGGPSAALVLADLAALGVRRVVRVGTCVGMDATAAPGTMLVVCDAVAAGGSAAALGIETGATVLPDAEMTESLLLELGGEPRAVRVASVDADPGSTAHQAGIAAADMQTAPLLAQAQALGLLAAAVLIVSESGERGLLEKERLEALERRAGRAAGSVLSG